MTNSTKCGLPYSVRRIIRQYAPAFRERLDRIVVDKYGDRVNQITWTELSECINAAFAELTGGVEESEPHPDPRMVKLSLEDFRAGRAIPAEEYLDELRSRLVSEGSEKED